MDLVYHVFCKEECSVFQNHRVPILLSIASVRAFHSDVRIFVIERKPTFFDWLDYPDRFDFQLLEQSHFSCEKLELSPVSLRCADIMHNIDLFDKDVLYVDSDVIWLDSWLPQPENKMVIFNEPRGEYQFVNTGLFALNKQNDSFDLFCEWHNLIINWKNHKKDLGDFLLSYNGDFNINDESTFAYLINQKNNVDRIVHTYDLALFNNRYLRSKEKLIHFLTHFASENKIDFIFKIREINEILHQVFTPADFCNFGIDWSYRGSVDLLNIHKSDKIMLI